MRQCRCCPVGKQRGSGKCPLLGRCCTTGKQGWSVSVRFRIGVALWVNREVRQCPLLGRCQVDLRVNKQVRQCPFLGQCCAVGKQRGASVSAFGSVSS